jgi:ABC-type sugar transport system substrate-binding protein
MEASVAQYPEAMGRIAIESAGKLIRGEPVPRDQRTKVGLVTRANVGAPR